MFRDFFLLMLAPYSAPVVGVTRLKSIRSYRDSDFFGKCIVVLFCIAALSGIVNNDWHSALASFILLLYKSFYDALQGDLEVRGFAVERLFAMLWSFSLIPVVFGILEKMASYFFDMSIYQVLFYSHSFKQAAGLYRIYSTFGNPNIAGTWFAALLIIGIGLYVNGVIKGPGNMLLLIANLQCLMWTGSKGAVLAMFGTLFLSFWAYRTPKRRIFIVLIFMAIYLLSQGEAAPVTHAAQPRDSIWVTTFKITIDHWLLGVGLIGGIDYIGEVHAHNLWLSMLLFTGVSGLIVVLTMQGYFLVQLWHLYKKEHPFFPMLFGVMMVMGLHSWIDFTIMSPQGSFLLVIYAAALISARRLVDSPDWDPSKSPYGDKPRIKKRLAASRKWSF